MAAWVFKNRSTTIEEHIDRVKYVRCPHCIHEEFFTVNMLRTMAPQRLAPKGIVPCVQCGADNSVPFFGGDLLASRGREAF